MRIVHVLKNGEIRESVDGIVIKDERFYQVLKNIQQKKKKNT